MYSERHTTSHFPRTRRGHCRVIYPSAFNVAASQGTGTIMTVSSKVTDHHNEYDHDENICHVIERQLPGDD